MDEEKPVSRRAKWLIIIGVLILIVGSGLAMIQSQRDAIANHAHDPGSIYDSQAPCFYFVVVLGFGFVFIGRGLLMFPETPWKIIGGLLLLAGIGPVLFVIFGVLVFVYERYR